MKKRNLAFSAASIIFVSFFTYVPQAVADPSPCSTTSESFELSGINYITETVVSTDPCTWTVPEGVSSALVLVVGGGGGGGGGASSSAGRGGGGGGGSGDVGTNTFSDLTPGDVWTITLGAGGAGGAPGVDGGSAAGDGGDGGRTSLGIEGVTYSSDGGQGGAAGTIVGGSGGNSGESGRLGGSASGVQGGSGASYNFNGDATTAYTDGLYVFQFSAEPATYANGGGGATSNTWGEMLHTAGSGGAGARGSLNTALERYGYAGVAGKNGTVLIRYVNPLSAPDTPSTPSAVGGDNEATVTWTPAESGDAPTSFLVTSNPGGATCEVDYPETSCTVTGLSNGTEYTFTVQAINSAGSSSESSASSPVLLLAVPQPPLRVVAVAGDGQVTVSWEHPETGGLPTTYVASSQPGAFTCEIEYPQTSCIVDGLENGVDYSFTVTASNVRGNSDESEPSNSATPAASSREFAPAKPYEGPLNLQIDSTITADSTSVIQGRRLSSISQVLINGEPIDFTLISDEKIEIRVPKLIAGEYTLGLVVPANNVTLTVSVQIVQLQAVANVGTFNGFIAVYAKGYKGEEISWKIAGKWFKTTVTKDFQVFQRRTAAVGLPVTVEIYFDKVLQIRKTLITR